MEHWNSGENFGPHKTRIRQWRQFEDRLSRFDTIPACDRRTDRWTDRQTDVQPIAKTYFSIADARKNWNTDLSFFRYFLFGIRYFLVIGIPTSVSVSVSVTDPGLFLSYDVAYVINRPELIPGRYSARWNVIGWYLARYNVISVHCNAVNLIKLSASNISHDRQVTCQ